MAKLNKRYADATILVDDLLGAANGVAQLDGTGRIPAGQLPTSTAEYKGAWNANTNTPTLINGTGTNGDFYRVSVEGTQDLGAGSDTYYVGDMVIYDGSVWQLIPDSSSFNGKTTDNLAEGATNFYYTEARFDTSLSGKDTGDLAEGSNLYFTEVRVEDTTLANYVVGADAAVANTDDLKGAIGKLQGQINAIPAGLSPQQEVITLLAGDITNGYVDLAASPSGGIAQVFPDNGIPQTPGADFSITGGNRLNFLGDLAAELIAGDVLVVNYQA
jgi:hypothetical protein